MYTKFLQILGKRIFLFSLVLIGTHGLSSSANANTLSELEEYNHKVAQRAHMTEYHDYTYVESSDDPKDVYQYSHYDAAKYSEIRCLKCGKIGKVSLRTYIGEAVWALGYRQCTKNIFKVDLVMAKDLSEFWSDETKALITPYLIKDKASKEKWDRIYDALKRKAKTIDARNA